LGHSRSYPSTSAWMWNHSIKWKVFQHDMKWTEDSHSNKMTRKIVLDLILLPVLGKPFGWWNVKISTIRHTVQTLHLRISICLDLWRRLSDVTDLQMRCSWRKRYMTGFALSPRSFFWQHHKACGPLEKVSWEARRLGRKVIHL
jgi:hypothetical protein